MEELLDQDEKNLSWFERHLGLSVGRFFLYLVLVVISGIYIGILLFGDNSLEVYMSLEEYEYDLKHKIVDLKEKNSVLQKEYFELRELNIDYNRDNK